jgi:protein tyrosine phosphatase type 4A
MSSKPTLIVSGRLRFLIMDAPRQSNLHLYLRECRRNRVTDVVRVCEPTYHGGELSAAGMRLHEMAYDDGRVPPPEVLDGWLALVEERFFPPPSASSGGGNGAVGSTKTDAQPPAAADAGGTIAVHCVAGLGRAPVLVAIALMEFEGMDAIDAVTMIRRSRRGAINENQLQYLEGYRRRRRGGGGKPGDGCGCSIM